MFLDFIVDIAKVGDSIRITCQDEIIDGTIVKIAPTLIAVRLLDGSLILKKDEEITDIALNPSKLEGKNTIEGSQNDSNIVLKKKEREVSVLNKNEIDNVINDSEITIGKYEEDWDSIDKNALIK